jgi:N-acetylmuramoyl-L-alanine amidase
LTLKLIGAKTPGYPANVVDPFPYFKETESPAPSDLTIYTTERVRLRSEPTTDSVQRAMLMQGEALTVLGDGDEARTKVGKTKQWIRVQRADGLDGYVAAWYTQLEPVSPAPPEPAPAGPLLVYATEALSVPRGPSTGTSRVAIALPHEPMTVIDDREAAVGKVGDRGEWLEVRLPRGLEGHIAAWYVQTEPGPAPPSLLVVSPTEDMNMRERPSTQARKIGRPVEDTPLTVHDDPQRARTLLGRYDEWLYVETPEGQRGWVAAWYVRIHIPSFEPTRALEPEPAGPLVVYATEALNVRRGPSTGTSRIAIALPHEPLEVVDEQRAALSRLGKYREWLQVRLPDGSTGHVAAWYVHRNPGRAPRSLVTVYPLANLNLRQRPTVRATRIGQALQGTPLTIHDDRERAEALAGRRDEWLYVETPEGQRGWVAAWYVSLTQV